MTLTLLDPNSGYGWEIETDEDLVLALQGREEMETVAEHYIRQAIQEAAEEKPVWVDLDELVRYICIYLI